MPQHYLDEMTGHGPFRTSENIEHPNIIFISTDMVPPEFYVPGALDIHTPNLDTLRDNHIFFTNSCATSPLCSPSRAAYLSGHHSYITTNSERAHDGHEIHVRPSDILFPEYLKAVGYHMRHVGKSHVGAHKFTDIFTENDSPWDRWSPPWYDEDAYITFLKEKGFDGLTFKKSIYGRDLLGNEGGNFYGGWLDEQKGKPFPKEATYPAYLVQRAINALNVRTDKDQPLYLQLDFFAPHQPFAIPAGMEQREREIRLNLSLPDSYNEWTENNHQSPWTEPRVYEIYRRNWGLHDAETVLDYRVANQLQFELIDELLGQLFDHLKTAGLYDDTWIFLVADHGEMNGEYALIDKGAYLNPRVIRTPIFIKPPTNHELGTTHETITAPVSLLDISPTILNIAGIKTDARLDGVSLFDTLKQIPRPVNKPILFEVWSHVIPNPCIGMTFTASDANNYIFTFNASDQIDELYTFSDNLDRNNLIDAEPDLRNEAIRTLHKHMSNDERWKSYKGYLELTYPEVLTEASGDRQLFF